MGVSTGKASEGGGEKHLGTQAPGGVSVIIYTLKAEARRISGVAGACKQIDANHVLQPRIEVSSSSGAPSQSVESRHRLLAALVCDPVVRRCTPAIRFFRGGGGRFPIVC